VVFRNGCKLEEIFYQLFIYVSCQKQVYKNIITCNIEGKQVDIIVKEWIQDSYSTNNVFLDNQILYYFNKEKGIEISHDLHCYK
jgi:hypothetical protein